MSSAKIGIIILSPRDLRKDEMRLHLIILPCRATTAPELTLSAGVVLCSHFLQLHAWHSEVIGKWKLLLMMMTFYFLLKTASGQ